MIEELCLRIWSHEKFQEEKNSLIFEGMRCTINNKYQSKCFNILPRLIQCASSFSLSKNHNFRKVAYEIAINALKIYNNTEEINKISFDNIVQVISFILTRLGNFPAEHFLKQQTSQDYNKTFPSPLWFEQEYHRNENTVKISENKEITLTDFQKELWMALVKNKVVVVNAPTSTGKSFALKNFLFAMYHNGTIKKAIYLVPTRALISQVIDEMSTMFKQEEKIKIHVTEVPFIQTESDYILFVLTQERLQILLDQLENDIIDFLIVDEAQNITDVSRGVILQSVIERMIDFFPELRIVFGTPFTENPDIFAYTFGFSSDTIKIINTEESPVSQNLIHIQTDSYIPKTFNISMVDNKDEKRSIFTIDTDTELIKDEHSLGQIALVLGRDKLNIIYGSEPVKCEKISSIISENLSIDKGKKIDPELEEFSQFIKQHIHKDYYLSEFIKNGIAYHYGNLPSFLRKGLEYLFSKGKISFITCTSTLLQGINLPAQNIFMKNPTKGNDVPLSSTEFWNLAGRAGRLTKDFEGNVYLIDIENWAENPLNKNKRQIINPSFSYFLRKRFDELINFIDDNEHPSGNVNTVGLENTFMKLFNDFRNGKIIEILERYNIPEKNIEIIVSKLNTISKNVTLPENITIKNPNVSIFRQQEMLNYLLKRIKEKGPKYLIPQHPLLKYDKIEDSYKRLFKRIHSHFEKLPGANKSHFYYAPLAILWMKGMSYSELLNNRIVYVNSIRKRGEANANVEARALFREVENDLRFRYVKYTNCYLDILSYALETLDYKDFAENLPPISLFLELGACSKTMISLIGLGLSRTGASIISKYAPQSDMETNKILIWLRQTNLSMKEIPLPIKRELENII